jgi:hypothetical protein
MQAKFERPNALTVQLDFDGLPASGTAPHGELKHAGESQKPWGGQPEWVRSRRHTVTETPSGIYLYISTSFLYASDFNLQNTVIASRMHKQLLGRKDGVAVQLIVLRLQDQLIYSLYDCVSCQFRTWTCNS